MNEMNDKICNYTKRGRHNNYDLQLYKKKLFGTWQFGKIDVLVIQKFARLKSKHFSQFFWWEVNLKRLRAFIFCFAKEKKLHQIQRKKKKILSKVQTMTSISKRFDERKIYKPVWQVSSSLQNLMSSLSVDVKVHPNRLCKELQSQQVVLMSTGLHIPYFRE